MTNETMSSPKNVAGEMLTKAANTSANHGENLSDYESVECPLCMENLDIDDLDFFPCSCEYQVCRFCWHRLKNDDNGLCPACRQPYPELPIHFSSLSIERVEEIKKLRKMKQKDKAKVKDSKMSDYATMRVVQKNLLFVIGIASKVPIEELRREFAKYGKIMKVVYSKASAYVTYYRAEDAVAAIKGLNETNKRLTNGQVVTAPGAPPPVFSMLRASLGTTKYCNNWLRNQACSKQPECMYLHEVADAEASFTKEQMQLGKHTEYERRLISHYLEVIERGRGTTTPRDASVGGGGGDYLGTSPPNDDKIRSYTFVNSKMGSSTGKEKNRVCSGDPKHNAGGGGVGGGGGNSARSSKESSPDNLANSQQQQRSTCPWATIATATAVAAGGCGDGTKAKENGGSKRLLCVDDDDDGGTTNHNNNATQLYSSSSSSTTSSGYGSNGLAGSDTDQSSLSSSTSTPDNVVHSQQQQQRQAENQTEAAAKGTKLPNEEEVIAGLLNGLDATSGSNLFVNGCKPIPPVAASSAFAGVPGPMSGSSAGETKSSAPTTAPTSTSMSFDFGNLLMRDHSSAATSSLLSGNPLAAEGGAVEADLDFDPISVCSRELDNMLRMLDSQLLGNDFGSGSGSLFENFQPTANQFGDVTALRFDDIGGGLNLNTTSSTNNPSNFGAPLGAAAAPNHHHQPHSRWDMSPTENLTLIDRFSKLNFNEQLHHNNAAPSNAAGGIMNGIVPPGAASGQLIRPAPGFGGNPMFNSNGGGGGGGGAIPNTNNINQMQQYEMFQQQQQQQQRRKMFNSAGNTQQQQQPPPQPPFDGANRNFANNVLTLANMMHCENSMPMKNGNGGQQWQQQQNSLRQMLPNVNIKFQQQQQQQQQLGLNESSGTGSLGFSGLTSQQQQNLSRLSQMETMFVNSLNNLQHQQPGTGNNNNNNNNNMFMGLGQPTAGNVPPMPQPRHMQRQFEHMMGMTPQQQQQHQQQQQQQHRSNLSKFFGNFNQHQASAGGAPATTGLLRSQQPPPGF